MESVARRTTGLDEDKAREAIALAGDRLVCCRGSPCAWLDASLAPGGEDLDWPERRHGAAVHLDPIDEESGVAIVEECLGNPGAARLALVVANHDRLSRGRGTGLIHDVEFYESTHRLIPLWGHLAGTFAPAHRL